LGIHSTEFLGFLTFELVYPFLCTLTSLIPFHDFCEIASD